MGNDAFVTRANSTRTLQDWYNLFQRVLSGDLYPRDSSSGAATDEAASLGSATYRWRKLNALSGEHTVGTIKWRLSYNGLVTPSHGWMLCDGRQINKSAYDTEHGAGTWDSKIIASPLEEKYLPDMVDRYLIGATAVSQDGAAALTPVGNADHEINVGHNHRWFKHNSSSAVADQSYDNAGALLNLPQPGTFKDASHYTLDRQSNATSVEVDFYTKKLTQTLDAQPASIEVLFYMRIA